MNWKQIRKKQILQNGNIVGEEIISKETREPKTFLGFKDYKVDLFIKSLSIITVLVAVLTFYITTKKDRDQQIYSDNLLKAQLNEANQRQNDFNKSLEANHQNLERQLSNNLQQIFMQKDNEIDKEKRNFDVTALTRASTDMNILLSKPPESESYVKAKDEILFELKPKIIILGNSFYNSLLDFEKYLPDYETTEEIISTMDSIEQCCIQLSNNFNKIEDIALINDFKNIDSKERFKYYLFKENQIDNYYTRANRYVDALKPNMYAQDPIGVDIFATTHTLSRFMSNVLSSVSTNVDQLKDVYYIFQTQKPDTSSFKFLIENQPVQNALNNNDDLRRRFIELKDKIFKKLNLSKIKYDQILKTRINFYRDKN